MLKIIIGNRIIIDAGELKASGVYSVLRKQFSHHNPEYFKKKYLGLPLYATPRKILSYKKDDEEGLITFPRGSLSVVTSTLKEENIDYKIIDGRLTLPSINIKYIGHAPRDYQAEGRRLVKKEEQGLILSSCGSGKTETALQTMADLKQPTLILVHRTPMLEGWISRINECLELDFPVGQLGDGKKKVTPVTVAMVQTAINMIGKLKYNFGLIIADEVHHFAARTFQSLLDHFPAKYMIGFTATLRRQDKKDFLIKETFGEILMEVETEELVERGLIHDVSVRMVPTDFYFDYNHEDLFERLIQDRQFPEEEEDEEFEIKMERRRQYLKEANLPWNDYKDYLKAVTEDEERNNLIVDRVCQELDRGEVCLILSARRKHCEVLADIIRGRGHPAFIMLGGKESKKKTDHAIEQLRIGKVRCGIATSVIEESVNIVNLNRGFITAPTATNEALLEQQMGRFRRRSEGKEDALIYYFWDKLINKFSSHPLILRKRYSVVKVERRKD